MFVACTLRFIETHGELGDELLQPELVSSVELGGSALVDDDQAPIVVAAHGGEVSPYEGPLLVNVISVLTVSVPQRSLRLTDILFAENVEYFRWDFT